MIYRTKIGGNGCMEVGYRIRVTNPLNTFCPLKELLYLINQEKVPEGSSLLLNFPSHPRSIDLELNTF
jgi:hypothetical protein